jgi:hypothetical protein
MSNSTILARIQEVIDKLKRCEVRLATAVNAIESHADALEAMPYSLVSELRPLLRDLITSDWPEDMEFAVPETPAVITRIEEWISKVQR